MANWGKAHLLRHRFTVRRRGASVEPEPVRPFEEPLSGVDVVVMLMDQRADIYDKLIEFAEIFPVPVQAAIGRHIDHEWRVVAKLRGMDEGEP